MKTGKALFTISFVLILIFLIPSCAVNPVSGKRQIMFVSEEQEIAMGTQYHPSVISTFGVYENDPLQKFLEEKGTQMGQLSHRPNLRYHFTILDSPVVNAFAVPGGYLYFTRGILAQMNSEAELIGVLGHEMGHVTARHTAQQQTNQQIGQIVLAGGMIASKEIYELADVAMAGMQLLFLSFSREHERESDRLGVEYATKMGYDANKMADFFGVLDKMSMASSEGGVPTFMSTHPDPKDRFTTVHSLTDTWQAKYPGEKFAVNSDHYLDMIDGIVYGEDPRQGFVENNTFYHPDLRFQFKFPDKWVLVNTPTQVQIISLDQKAGIIFTLSEESTPAAASQKALGDLRLTALDSKTVSVNGNEAVEVVSQQVNQAQDGSQTVTKVMSYFIKKGEKVYIFHGISNGTTFDNYLPAFESTGRDFKVLTDQNKINIKPERIRVKTAPKSASLQELFAALNVPKDQYKEFALLNNKELSTRLEKGDRFKIVSK
ncbi:M48 family metalloprotease [Maribellus sediminis]|uniref:M48 family metalloprotease n=1 Tax=Maribellus sediminis TaxID=2696285 RepID=UPI0014308310|nr:M48 family metalloprotease [Maribellus sediminis]